MATDGFRSLTTQHLFLSHAPDQIPAWMCWDLAQELTRLMYVHFTRYGEKNQYEGIKTLGRVILLPQNKRRAAVVSFCAILICEMRAFRHRTLSIFTIICCRHHSISPLYLIARCSYYIFFIVDLGCDSWNRTRKTNLQSLSTSPAQIRSPLQRDGLTDAGAAESLARSPWLRPPRGLEDETPPFRATHHVCW